MRNGIARRVGVGPTRETKTQYRSAERLAGMTQPWAPPWRLALVSAR